MTIATRKPPRKRTASASSRDLANQLHETVTCTGNSYLRHAVAAVESSIGPVRHFNAMQAVAGYVQACATLQAAELMAGALDRNTAALDALAKSRTV